MHHLFSEFIDTAPAPAAPAPASPLESSSGSSKIGLIVGVVIGSVVVLTVVGVIIARKMNKKVDSSSAEVVSRSAWHPSNYPSNTEL